MVYRAQFEQFVIQTLTGWFHSYITALQFWKRSKTILLNISTLKISLKPRGRRLNNWNSTLCKDDCMYLLSNIIIIALKLSKTNWNGDVSRKFFFDKTVLRFLKVFLYFSVENSTLIVASPYHRWPWFEQTWIYNSWLCFYIMI